MKIVELAIPSQNYRARIHAEGCRDIRSDKSRGYTDVYAQDTTPADWLEENYADIASDSEEPGTREWREEVVYQAGEIEVLPCARAIGFTFDGYVDQNS